MFCLEHMQYDVVNLSFIFLYGEGTLFLYVSKTDPCDLIQVLKVSKPKHNLVYEFFTYAMFT